MATVIPMLPPTPRQITFVEIDTLAPANSIVLAVRIVPEEGYEATYVVAIQRGCAMLIRDGTILSVFNHDANEKYFLTNASLYITQDNQLHWFPFNELNDDEHEVFELEPGDKPTDLVEVARGAFICTTRSRTTAIHRVYTCRVSSGDQANDIEIKHEHTSPLALAANGAQWQSVICKVDQPMIYHTMFQPIHSLFVDPAVGFWHADIDDTVNPITMRIPFMTTVDRIGLDLYIGKFTLNRVTKWYVGSMYPA